jgi:hypothetical protein
MNNANIYTDARAPCKQIKEVPIEVSYLFDDIFSSAATGIVPTFLALTP